MDVFFTVYFGKNMDKHRITSTTFEVNTGMTGAGVGAGVAGGGGASPVAKCWRCAGMPLVKYSTA